MSTTKTVIGADGEDVTGAYHYDCGVDYILTDSGEKLLICYDGTDWRRLKTLQELAKDALAVQDACNLSGVVHSFSRAMHHLTSRLRADGLYEGTHSVNFHPVCILWSDKIADLTGSRSHAAFSGALDSVMELANPVSSDS